MVRELTGLVNCFLAFHLHGTMFFAYITAFIITPKLSLTNTQIGDSKAEKIVLNFHGTSSFPNPPNCNHT